MDMKEMLFDLCRAQGVSGSEKNAASAAEKYFAGIAETRRDSNGNLIAELGNKSAEKTILLDAHLDRIGLIVTDFDENGYVRVDACGGIDVRTLQDTVLISENGLKGTVCCMPPHLVGGSADKATPISKTWVDFGMTADEIKSKLSVGDVLTFSAEPSQLLNGRIASPALDNRAGVASLIRCAELLSGKELEYRVVIVLSAQEETFGSGAKTSAYSINPYEAIAVDVSFASQPDVSGQYGGIELGKGPMIAVAAVLDKPMSKYLIKLASDKNIPYQLEPLSGRTGTNGDAISVTRGGVRTALVSIPQRYLHTPNEVVELSDVENTARLIAEYIISGGAENA